MLVTGVVTRNMAVPLAKTIEAVPGRGWWWRRGLRAGRGVFRGGYGWSAGWRSPSPTWRSPGARRIRWRSRGAARADRTVSAVLPGRGPLGLAAALAGLVLPRPAGAVGGRSPRRDAAAFAAAAMVLVRGRRARRPLLPLTGVVVHSTARRGLRRRRSGRRGGEHAFGRLPGRGHQPGRAALLPLFVTSLLLVPAAASVATFMARGS